jgi:ketosteroid isomerase-like protein
MTATTLVRTFLDHVFAGRLDDALALVAPDARFIATRPTPNPHNPLHGTFVGPEGARRFFTGFGQLLEPGAFHVEAAFGEGPHAALHGTLRHTSRQTGKPFASDWALICRVQDGRLALYHFFEDTEALREALAP